MHFSFIMNSKKTVFRSRFELSLKVSLCKVFVLLAILLDTSTINANEISEDSGGGSFSKNSILGIDKSGAKEVGSSNDCPSRPVIKLVTPKSVLKAEKIIYNETSGDIFSPFRTDLALECRSSRPIDFDFEGKLVFKLTSVETSRTWYENDGNEECYSIIVRFATSREATGNYRCWNIQDEKTTATAAALYVYGYGGTPPYLLHSDIGVIDVTAKATDEFAVLPCVTTNPNISVALYKIETEGFIRVPLGDHLTYNPKIGFTLALRKIPDPFVQYKCIAQNSSHSDVIARVKEVKDTVTKLANENIEILVDQFPPNQSAIVCSGESFNLSLHSTSNCETPIQCRLEEKCMKGETVCSTQPCSCSREGHRCTRSLKVKLFDSKVFLGQGCKTVPKNEHGGNVQCKNNYGDIAVSKYFTGLHGKIIENWQNVPRRDILKLSTVLNADYDIYYVGEDVEFICIGSRYLFSSGFQWKIQLINGTLISANASEVNRNQKKSVIEEKAKIKISIPELQNVICIAPLWNESTWVNSSLYLRIRDTVPPIFINPENITVYNYANEKNVTLTCEAKGYPSPDILWLRNGEEFRTDFIFDNSIGNVTKAYLTLKEITESDHDVVYTCNATNPRGTAFKTFTIYVRDHPSTLIFSLIGVGLTIFFGVVLFISVILLRRMQKKKTSYVFHFSDFDMKDFKHGNPEAVKKCTDVCEKAFYLPYDDTMYEINEDELLIDYDNILGSGEFGVVLKGIVTKNNITMPVAVKTLRGNEMNNLKSLLSELKIMMYIGDHKNIVKLLGAVTRNLLEKRVFVVVEYCALGNLENYLRQHRPTFLDEFENTRSSVVPNAPLPSYVRIEYLVKTSDLIRWGYQIATAMEYLANKKVIHGDLALRNTLLDSSQNVKITDFGLSKHLYKCASNYVTKRKDVPLPWRWLAIETLQDYNFCTQSDVWSYGITLWELFSLAEVPYTGVSFNAEFLRQLGNGYRLDRPRYCNSEIYSIMRDCWRKDSSQRPSFTTLRQSFGQMLPPGTIEADNECEITSQNETNHLKEEFLLPNSNNIEPGVRHTRV